MEVIPGSGGKVIVVKGQTSPWKKYWMIKVKIIKLCIIIAMVLKTNLQYIVRIVEIVGFHDIESNYIILMLMFSGYY